MCVWVASSSQPRVWSPCNLGLTPSSLSHEPRIEEGERSRGRSRQRRRGMELTTPAFPGGPQLRSPPPRGGAGVTIIVVLGGDGLPGRLGGLVSLNVLRTYVGGCSPRGGLHRITDETHWSSVGKTQDFGSRTSGPCSRMAHVRWYFLKHKGSLP